MSYQPLLFINGTACFEKCKHLLECQIVLFLMEQQALKNVSNCLSTTIYSYLETSGGQCSYPYLNVFNFLNTY